MKSFKSVVFSAITALLLAVSLSGCLGDEKTASQGGENGSALSNSGKVKLVLRPGVRAVSIDFLTDNKRLEQRSIIESALKKNGFVINNVSMGELSENYIYFGIEPMDKQVVLYLDRDGLLAITVVSGSDIVAKWNPMIGDEVKYAG